MKFAEFKERIESEYHKRFNDSYCKCNVYKCLGTSITIDCYLAKDKTEVPHGIAANDTFRVSFMIHMPDGWSKEDEMPEMMVMDAIKKSIKIKPEEGTYCYCSSKSVSYRKAKGNAEKLIKSFDKVCDRLFDMVIKEYRSDNLMSDGAELVALKGYAA